MKDTIYVEREDRLVFHTSIDEPVKWYTVVDGNLILTDSAIVYMNSFLLEKEGVTVENCSRVVVEQTNGMKHILNCKEI